MDYNAKVATASAYAQQQQGMNAGNGALASGEAVERSTLAGEFDYRLRVISERVGKLNADMGSLADRALGSVPEAKPDIPPSSPPTAFGNIANRLDAIDRAITDAENNFQRLHQIA